MLGDLLLEEGELIRESQRDSGERDARTALRSEVKILPAEAELTEQLAQRPGLRSGLGVVRDGVQADVVVPFAEPIKRIQPADRRVLFDDADGPLVIRQPNPRRES